MPRRRGTTTGPTRSMRLPVALDEWFEARMQAHRHRSTSDVLVELVHGGLRLRDGYMSVHRYALEGRVADPTAYAEYRSCLQDTFGPEYVEHLERWLDADGIRTTLTA
jgi:hypothetical protein